jgi:hypothetical protein
VLPHRLYVNDRTGQHINLTKNSLTRLNSRPKTAQFWPSVCLNELTSILRFIENKPDPVKSIIMNAQYICKGLEYALPKFTVKRLFLTHSIIYSDKIAAGPVAVVARLWSPLSMTVPGTDKVGAVNSILTSTFLTFPNVLGIFNLPKPYPDPVNDSGDRHGHINSNRNIEIERCCHRGHYIDHQMFQGLKSEGCVVGAVIGIPPIDALVGTNRSPYSLFGVGGYS